MIRFHPNQDIPPWALVAYALGPVCLVYGVLWDVSWHTTIGRDTFWSPPHIPVQIGALVPALVSAYFIFRSSFLTGTEKNRAEISIGPFRGPFGAFVCLWGDAIVLFAIPFDNWWHEAYGLDVQTFSPPHILGFSGAAFVALGSICIFAREQAAGFLRTSLMASLVGIFGLIWCDFNYPVLYHHPIFYFFYCCTFSGVLIFLSSGFQGRWLATKSALVFMGIWLSMTWILPLFDGSPKLGPIYFPRETMLPTRFPVLLVFPALAVDWWLLDRSKTRDLVSACVLGTLFVAIFLPVHWAFGYFLLSPYSDNWFFAAHEFPFFTNPGPWLHEFLLPLNSDGNYNFALAVPLFIGTIVGSQMSSWVGLKMGRWLQSVQR